MDKLAQKRSLRSKIWENVNLTGRGLEGLHPEFKQLMTNMRKTDKAIRESADDVRQAVRYARSALRRRDYLNAAHFITGFHQCLRYVAHYLNKFLQSVDVDHFNYLLKNFKNRHKDQIFEYDPNAEIKEACRQFDAITKEAGIYDWLQDKALHIYDFTTDTASNIITTPGRTRRLMNKRFNVGFMKLLKEETEEMVLESSSMLKDLLRVLDELESGVSRRNPGLYIEKAKDFVQMFNEFHKKYESFYKKVILPLKEFKQKAEKEILDQEQEAARQQAAQKAQHEQAEMEAAENTFFVSPQRFITPESPSNKPYVEPSFEQWKNSPSKIENESVLNQLDETHNAKRFTVEQPHETPKVQKEPLPEQKYPKTPSNVKIQPELAKAVSQETQPKEYTNLVKKIEEETVEDAAPPSKAAEDNHFVAQLQVYANANDVTSFVKELLDYSEFIEEMDAEKSVELLSVANEIMTQQKAAGFWDRIRGKKPQKESPKTQELQRGSQPVSPKATNDLMRDVTEDQTRYLRKKIDIPDGLVNESYTSLSFLSNIGPSRISISPKTAERIIENFLEVLANNLDNKVQQYVQPVRQRLIPLIKQAIYNGLVTSIASVTDVNNPHDRYFDVYNRFSLDQIDSNLPGYAKLYIYCRISPDKNIVSVRGINKYFKVVGLTPNKPPPPTNQSPPPSTKTSKEELVEEYDEDPDHGQFDDYVDPYDYYDTDY